MFLFAAGATAQTSWLDRSVRNWNTSNTVPRAPNVTTDADVSRMCSSTVRNAGTAQERALTQRGWRLYGSTQTYGSFTLLYGLAGFDGMCRPTNYNVFVFSGNRFIGTLSPTPMHSRTDGSLMWATIWDNELITAEFARYAANDALCCPSRRSSVIYELPETMAGRLTPGDVSTFGVTQADNPSTQRNVTGTITFRGQRTLPAGSIVVVKLLDVSRSDASGILVAEQRIEAGGERFPIEFSIPYDPEDIRTRNRYNVRAEILRNGRLTYVSDVANPVLTLGNPQTAEIVVAPVRAGGGNNNTTNRTIRGSVTYLQRIALPPDASVQVRLVELAADGTAAETIAETEFDPGTRQVPIDFELGYAQSSIERNANYGMEAEILSAGEVFFRTETPQAVRLSGVNTNNVRLTLVQAETVVTGRSISLSKFGSGSLRIGDRSSSFLFRGSAEVETDGDATVSVLGTGGTIAFSGKVVEFTDDLIRIRVTNSGNADASGEILLNYNGRSLRSISGKDLILDSQETTLDL